MYPAKKPAKRERPAAQPQRPALAQPAIRLPRPPRTPGAPPASRAARAARRDDGLSRPRIVEAAIELLDAEGESGLTFRALAAQLATGAGALYWHIASKEELIAAASERLVTSALAEVVAPSAPRRAIRAIAVGLFEAIVAHPWLGALLSHGPWQGATMQLFERVGRQLQAMKISEATQLTAASTLVGYILGASHQHAANRRRFTPGANRAEFLAAEAARWKALDAEAYPFTRRVASRLAKHDHRTEFLAGIDLILDGIEARA